MSTPILDPAMLTFMQELKANNNREWYTPRKDEYKALRAKFTNFLTALAGEIADFDPAIASLLGREKVIKVFRLNRDTRFSRDKTPYKTHFSGFVSSGSHHCQSPCYYLHIGADELFLGGGLHMPESEVLKAVRAKISDHPKSLPPILADTDFQKTYTDLDRNLTLKTAPKGYPKDHPQIEFLRLKSFTATRQLSKKEVFAPDFFTQVKENFRTLAPLVQFLRVDPL